MTKQQKRGVRLWRHLTRARKTTMYLATEAIRNLGKADVISEELLQASRACLDQIVRLETVLMCQGVYWKREKGVP